MQLMHFLLITFCVLYVCSGIPLVDRRQVCGGDYDCVVVKGPDATLRLDLPDLSTATGKDVLQRLPEWMTPPRPRRQLLFRGHPIRAERRLVEYGVRLNDEIRMVEREGGTASGEL
eukprot:GGOE01020877.1.p2 GENE.GGOE01020877.1~~GGOE01020877.1.p2  ORF type:complete len:116 (-),score=21.01 GGOE01020877.1:476-823(-)